MTTFSWRYDFTGAARTWVVSIMFCAVGVICGLVAPYALNPSPPPGSLFADGLVVRIEAEKRMVRPIFQFADQLGMSREFSSAVASNKSAYHLGERIVVVFNPADPSNAYVKDDKDLLIALWILRILGAVFLGIGLSVLGMKLKGMDDDVISRVGGLIGALTYAIPASFVLPGLWAAYSFRPNWLFEPDAIFGFDQWLIGSIFSATGLLALVGTIIVYRYQARTGKTGWYWSRSWGSSSK